MDGPPREVHEKIDQDNKIPDLFFDHLKSAETLIYVIEMYLKELKILGVSLHFIFNITWNEYESKFI